MAVLSRSIYVFAFLDAIFVALSTLICFMGIATRFPQWFGIAAIFTFVILFVLAIKGFYRIRKYGFKDLYTLLEGVLIGSFIATILTIPLLNGIATYLTLYNVLIIYVGLVFSRLVYLTYK